MKVIGEIDIGIAFTTPTVIGTLKADVPSLLISGSSEQKTPNRVLTYSITAGTLPTGITLIQTGKSHRCDRSKRLHRFNKSIHVHRHGQRSIPRSRHIQGIHRELRYPIHTDGIWKHVRSCNIVH
jgi:hypothetical protein